MKIDKNIPIPNRNRNRHGKWKDLVSKMDVGDSVLIKIKDRSSINNAMVAQGYKGTSRMEDGKVRVWRLS